MISKCSNPQCGKPFRYLSHGKLFSFPAGKSGLRVGAVCWHWLCGECAQRFKLVADASGSISVAWSDGRAKAAAPAA